MKKVLVLSDLHYPEIQKDEILRIVEKEESDEVVFLGDCVFPDDRVNEFLEIVDRIKSESKVSLIRGDEDSSLLPTLNSVKINLGRHNFAFIHGHQFNFGSEEFTVKLVSFVQGASRTFPLFTYSIVAKAREGMKKDEFLILGHTHALQCFPRLRVGCAGCLTHVPRLYHERGYIVIQEKEESTSSQARGGSFINIDAVSLRFESLFPDKERSKIFQLYKK